ncbi:transporter [Penicillium hetheringtonii]|uniref:Transporter n=1 Tax=Penicillium hetheringtonii TaxID=911720 RepID=A0AAD6GVA3_9EURO|nr:transporter [Penicillium hetheringtonii]
MGSWLLIAYNFGSCVAQPVAISGVSSSLVELAFARIVAGIGGAGMVSLTSIIITDVIPPEEIALYDGYSSTVNMIGRSLGPPLGGLLSQTIGWRLPAPLAQLPGPKHQGPKKPSLNQVDTAGLLALSLAIAALSFLVEQLAMPNPEDQSSLITFGLLAATVAFSVGFGLIERFWATNPLIPVDLMMGQFGRWCVIELLIYTGRGGLLCLLTPYLIRVENWPDVGASIAFVGNALGISAGGLVAGHMVKRTKKYKNLGVSAICLSIFAYFLIWFQWRDGCSILEASIPTLLGLGTGMTYTATFIGMTATTPKDRLPVCIVTLELFLNVGFIVGPAISTAVVQKVFAKGLANSLPSDGASAKSSKVINGVLNDAMFAQNLNDGAKDIVRARYLDAFQFAPLFAVVCGVATLVVFSLSKVASIKGSLWVVMI